MILVVFARFLALYCDGVVACHLRVFFVHSFNFVLPRRPVLLFLAALYSEGTPDR